MYSRLDLNGSWKAYCDDGLRGGLYFQASAPYKEKRWFDVAVPGEIHDDLMKLGIIENVYEKDGCLKARWVEECFWTYRKEFVADQDMVDANARIVFEGLDLNAVIYLNGEKIGEHHNFFYPCKVDITGKLKKGINILMVQLEAGLFGASDKPIEPYFTATQTADVKLHKRMWHRKPQSQFGWDWCQRLINVGIYRDVFVEFTEKIHLDGLSILHDLNENFSQGKVIVRQYVNNFGEKKIGILKIFVNEMEYIFDQCMDNGNSLLEATILIKNPNLWFPRGYGNQNLYNIRVELILDDISYVCGGRNVGFRRVRVNKEKHPEKGNYFIFEVNDIKVFAKGANFVPADMIFSNVNNERYESLIALALEANFNFLRVWGGGLYESDTFYDLCDKCGILVWQDFIFACGTYPTHNPDFMEDVKKEAIYNIRRLSHHASLIAWCGNNEQEWQTYEMNSGILYPDYALYHHVLPVLLQQNDPFKFYQPSSPFSDNHELPNADHTGDQHPWGVGIGNSDFYNYRNFECRFANEGGVLGPTSIPNTMRCLSEKQQYMHSFEYYMHDNILENFMHNPNTSPDEIVKIFTGLSPEEMTLTQYAFLGGLLQGEGLKEYIDNFRRRKFDASAAVFWMYNDCFPVTRSWTIVDYSLNKTPAYYPVKRAFTDISVVLCSEGDEINIYGVNDTLQDWQGKLRYGIFDFCGSYIKDDEISVVIPANSSVILARIEKTIITNYAKQCAFAVMQNESDCVRNRLIIPRFKDLELQLPQILVTKQEGGVRLCSDSFVWGVCLDLDGDKPLSDNFFDLYPNQPYFISCNNLDLKILHTGNEFIVKT